MTPGSRRCDHNPAAPRLDPSNRLPDDAPKMCADLVDRLGELFDEWWKFPELTGANLVAKGARVLVRRSSRREAWVLVGRALLIRFDRRTWRCGRPRFDADDTVEAPSIAELAAETGLNISRVKRALADYSTAGYFTYQRAVMEYPDGNRFCGLPSIRRVTELFLRRLRIKPSKAAAQQRHARAAYDRRRERPTSGAGRQRVRRILRATAGRQRPRYQAPPPPPAPTIPRPSKDAAYNDQVRQERMRLVFEHPDWGLERCDAEARRIVRPTEG